MQPDRSNWVLGLRQEEDERQVRRIEETSGKGIGPLSEGWCWSCQGGLLGKKHIYREVTLDPGGARTS